MDFFNNIFKPSRKENLMLKDQDRFPNSLSYINKIYALKKKHYINKKVKAIFSNPLYSVFRRVIYILVKLYILAEPELKD